MRRKLLLVIIILLFIASSLLVVLFVEFFTLDQRVHLSGNVVPLVQVSQNLGPTDPNTQLQLTISLRLRNEAELNLLLTAISDPNSSQYQHYITADQFKQRYAPTSNQVQKVVAFLQSQGLKVTTISRNNTLIDAVGTVALAEEAFAVQIYNYKFKKHTFYANADEPSVPVSLSNIILSIGGLDNAAKGHPETIIL